MNVYLIQHRECESRIISAFNTQKQADDECAELNQKWIDEKRKFMIFSGYTAAKAADWIIGHRLPYTVEVVPVTLYKETPVPYETPEWRLSAYIDWKPKFVDIKCPSCFGSGTVGGGFKSLEGPRECPQCLGRTYISKGPEGKAPEVPPELLSAMRAAWADHMGEQIKSE